MLPLLRFLKTWPVVGSHTTPDIAVILQPLEDTIRHVLIPTLTGQSPNDTERDLFALPPQWDGLGLLNPTVCAGDEFSASYHITKLLSDYLLNWNCSYMNVKADHARLGTILTPIAMTIDIPLMVYSLSLQLAQLQGVLSSCTSVSISCQYLAHPESLLYRPDIACLSPCHIWLPN